jgi:polyisoprenoid-binding protein YceI
MKTLAMTLVLLGISAPALAADYTLDGSHSYVGFSVRHMMVANQRGQFHDVSGTLTVHEADLTKSRVEVAIGVASIDTHEPKRDEHLKAADFFDVAKYPSITFKSSKVERAKDGRLKISGDLTMHGVSKRVVLDAEPLSPESKDPFGNIKRGTSATTKLNRKDFGLVWNKLLETGGVAVGEEITITLELEFTRK